jgi:hypothetical protein
VWPRYGVSEFEREPLTQVRRKGELVKDAFATAFHVPLKERRNAVYLYAPLIERPDLFLKFARLAEREVDRDVWLDWIHAYGVLGLERAGRSYRARDEGGRAETFLRFRLEAREAKETLELYEAASNPDEPDLGHVKNYVRRHVPFPEGAAGYLAMDADSLRTWALEEAGKRVQEKLVTECRPQLYLQKDGSFAMSYDFSSLLGAMYLQMAFLMGPSSGKRYCKGPNCNRVITFDTPEHPIAAAGLKKNDRSSGYRTRIDKEFCSRACISRWHYWNKKLSGQQLKLSDH